MSAESLLRFVARLFTRLVYRITTLGLTHVPKTGPALLVSNHLSLADGFLVGAALRRPVRFLIWRPYYEAYPWRWFLKRLRAIPVCK